MATLNFKEALRKIKGYFNPNEVGGFWESPTADALTKTQKFIQRVPERPVQFKTVLPQAPAPIRFVANLPQTIVSETVNIPNRVIYNANKIGSAKTKNELIRGVAGAGSALLDIATLGVGSSIAREGIEQVTKEGIEQAGKETFKEALKKLRAEPLKATLNAIKTSQGVKLGASSGALQGTQDAIDLNPNASMTDILKKATTTGVIGAGIGLVAEPTLKYGSELTVKGLKKANKAYKGSKYADQTGAIDPNELGGSMERILSGKSKALDQELPGAKIGMQLDIDTAIKTLNNPDEVNVKALQKAYNDISRTTLYKSFNPDTALKALSYYTDTLGGDAITQAQKKVFGTRVMTPDLVRSFWKELKDQTVARTGKSYKQIEQEADESLLTMVDDMLGSKASQESISKETMQSILQPTIRNEADNIYGSAKTILDSLPKRVDVDEQTAQVAFDGGIGALKQAFQEIEDRATKLVSKDDFVDMIEGKKPIDRRVADLIDTHKRLADDLIDTTENPEIGRVENYFPHATDQTTKIMDELFPNVWIDRLNTLGGHFMKRTGALKEYDKNYAKVMGDYTEQALYEKYRPAFKKSTPAIEEIVEHVKKAGDDLMDYVEVLKPEKLKGEIKFSTRSNIGKTPARTYNDIFSKIGKEAPDIFNAFRKVRDNSAHRELWMQDIAKIFDPHNPRKTYQYLAENVLGLKGTDADSFIISALNTGNRITPERFITQVLFQTKKMAIQDFIESTAQYSYKEGATKGIVNYYIDGLMKKEALEPAVLDFMANGMTRLFSMAHLGGNIKTGVIQALEINRIPATYGPKNFLEGLKSSVIEPNRIKKDYGFGDMKPHYLIDDYYTKVKPTLPKEIATKFESGLMKHIQIMENWKNTVYAGAAEAQGKALGLSGKDLYNHVRDSVYKYAHVADEFNTPAFLMSREKIGKGFSDGKGLISTGALSRAMLQYGQFAIKNSFGKLDALQEKEMGKLVGLFLADAVNLAITMTAFSMGRNALENAVKQFAPTSLGPIAQIPFQLSEAWTNYQEAKEQGYSANYESQALAKLLIGSFIPGGTQFNKTKGQVDTMLQGYKPTASGLVAYPESGSALENIYGLLFGQSSTPSGKRYGSEGQPYLRENQSEVYKMLYQDDPQSARDYYKSTVEDRKQKGNTVEAILNGTSKSTAIKTASDGSLILPTPSGNIYSVEDLLMVDAAKEKKNSTITQILTRRDQYEALPQGDKFTQMALEQEGITSEDYKTWKVKRVNSQLTGKEKADAFMQMIKSGETNFTQLYKDGVLTKGEIEDLERYGYINDAEELYKKLQMTDSYYIKKEMNKLKKDTMEKLLKNQADTRKQLVKESAKQEINLLQEMAKVQNRRPKKLPRVKVSLSAEKAGLNFTPKKYAPQLQKRVGQ